MFRVFAYLVLAGFVAIVAYSLYEARDEPAALVVGAVIAVIVFGSIVGKILSNLTKPRVKNWDDGRVGVGTVTRIRQSGLSGGIRNYEISMQVEGEDGSSFPGTLNARVGTRRLKGLEVDYRFPVIYQASKPQRLLVPQDHLATPAQHMFDYICQREGLIDQDAINADYWGIPAKASVLKAKTTGRRDIDRAEYNIVVSVFPITGGSFRSTAQMFLSAYEQRLLQLSEYVDAKFLPENPSRVVLRIPRNTKALEKQAKRK